MRRPALRFRPRPKAAPIRSGRHPARQPPGSAREVACPPPDASVLSRERTRDHQPGVSQIKTLTDNPRKIQDLRYDHPVTFRRKVIRYVIAEHVSRIPKHGPPFFSANFPRSPHYLPK